MNKWLSKKKGAIFFDLMTMSDIAYTVAVLENVMRFGTKSITRRRCLEQSGSCT
jgi:hypothetical protein